MTSILHQLKLAATAPVQPPSPTGSAPTPAPAPATAEAAPKPPPAVVGGLTKAPTVMPTAGAGAFTVQHPGLGDGSIDTAQIEQQQAMQEQQLADTQLKADQVTKSWEESQKALQNHTKQWLSSMESRLKTASDLAFSGPLDGRSPTGAGPAPVVDSPGVFDPGSGIGKAYNWGRKALLGGLWNRYAPKPMGNITDLNTRFGRKYYDAAETVGRMTQKEPPGVALLANLAGGMISKYTGSGGDLSSIGTDSSSLIDKAKELVSQ